MSGVAKGVTNEKKQKHEKERAVKGCVVCNGDIRDYERARPQVSDYDLVIAADGGFKHLKAMRLSPHAVIGDMDSVDADSLQDGGPEQISYPEKKDKSDAELAVELAFTRGCDFVALLGASGARLDHTLGNVSLLAKYPGRLAMVEGGTTLVAVDPSKKCKLHGKPGATVSLVPFPLAEKVTTQGLEYILEKEDLPPGTRGISNKLAQENGCVCTGSGLLLVYIDNDAT